jgi:hypothetical protein
MVSIIGLKSEFIISKVTKAKFKKLRMSSVKIFGNFKMASGFFLPGLKPKSIFEISQNTP